MSDFAISVVICTKNRRTSLLRLIDSIKKQMFNKAFELIIVDASDIFDKIEDDTDNITVRHIKSEFSNLPLQRSNAIKIAKSEFIYFFDDDVTLNPDFLNLTFDCLINSSENIAGVSGNIEFLPKSNLSIRSYFRKLLAGVYQKKPNSYISLAGISKTYLDHFPDSILIDNLRGPSMIYKTKYLKELSNLPWLYDLYQKRQGRAEDLALSSSISKHGFKYILLPSAGVIHHTENPGSPFARNGFNKGIADTYGKYIVAKNSLPSWSLINKIMFFRYVLVNFIFNLYLVFKDFEFIKGYVFGIFKIFKIKK
jgi:glycosyltransferase involved in cell wall biosynthesis